MSATDRRRQPRLAHAASRGRGHALGSRRRHHAARAPGAQRSRTGRTAARARRHAGLRRRRGAASGGAVGLFLAALLVAGLVTAGIVYAAMSASLPDPNAALRAAATRPPSSLTATASVLAKLFAEQNRSDQPLSEIPLTLQHAVIATEDQRFYEHAASTRSASRARSFTDIVLRRKAQGGSTITQQYVKQAFVGDESSLKRKVREAMLAQRIEKRYTKNQILELYLNTIYFGHGAYGVEAASQVYFGKTVSKLTLPSRR